MPNYLERVAMSAAGRGPRPRPPVSGPPLPVGMPAQPAPMEMDIASIENPSPAAVPQVSGVELKPRSAEPRTAPVVPNPPVAPPSLPARPDRTAFPAIAPRTTIRMPKTLRAAEPQAGGVTAPPPSDEDLVTVPAEPIEVMTVPVSVTEDPWASAIAVQAQQHVWALLRQQLGPRKRGGRPGLSGKT